MSDVEYTADVVIAGSGAAAPVGALTPKEQGLEPPVLEKSDKIGGSNAKAGPTAARERPIASRSSMNPIAGPVAWPARRGRAREAPTPTIISTDSDADIEKKGTRLLAACSPARSQPSASPPPGWARRADGASGYIESLHAQRPELTLTVIVPELAMRHWWQRRLHDDTASRLRRALEPLSKIVVTSIPFHI
jgi:hypothetical protein